MFSAHSAPCFKSTPFYFVVLIDFVFDFVLLNRLGDCDILPSLAISISFSQKFSLHHRGQKDYNPTFSVPPESHDLEFLGQDLSRLRRWPSASQLQLRCSQGGVSKYSLDHMIFPISVLSDANFQWGAVVSFGFHIFPLGFRNLSYSTPICSSLFPTF